MIIGIKRDVFCLFFLIFLAMIFFISFTSAATYVTGYVNNSLDGVSANGYEVVLWNPANGINDNVTDIIGQNGNSGVDNNYLIDCEELDNGCSIGNQIRAKVLNNGSDYITEEVNVIITGTVNVMPNSRLNSPPNATLLFPINNANLTNSSLTFSCQANDLDANLANVTLYGNWTSGWHANETKTATGSFNITNFTKVLQDGRYIWNCLPGDNLSIAKFANQNFSFTLDTTPPNITSVELNLTGDSCGIINRIRVNCTLTDSLSGIDKVWIQAREGNGSYINYSASLLSGNTYYSDILLNNLGDWNFSCYANDTFGNTGNKSASSGVDIHTNGIDLTLASSDITFSTTEPVENQEVIINATILNDGCSASSPFSVGFYSNDPEAGGIQIGNNQTLSLVGLTNGTVNITWNALIGTTNIFVLADVANVILESNETNNKNNRTITVDAWQEFYGDISLDKLLGDSQFMNLSFWFNESSFSGNLFVVDSESEVSWVSLEAIGKNKTGANVSGDFDDIDALLSMSTFADSVKNIFTLEGNTPRQTEEFILHDRNITEVPIVNSTNNTNFVTGILWDTSDDSNGQYSQADREDLIFVTKINQDAQGAYGVYDYEIRVPARLREYDNTDDSLIYFYFDLV